MARGLITGPVFVGWDCRPCDMISIENRNARVLNTYPNGVDVEFNDGSRDRYSYQFLADMRAQYVAMIVPIGPAASPTG